MVCLFSLILLHKSNLVADNPRDISSKVITRVDLVCTDSGAQIFVRATNTIQFQQRALTLPLPSIPGSRLCPVAALRHHLALNPGSGSTPFFQCFLGPSFTFSHISSFWFFFSYLPASFGTFFFFFSPHLVSDAVVQPSHLTVVFPLKLSSLWEIGRMMPTLFT